MSPLEPLLPELRLFPVYLLTGLLAGVTGGLLGLGGGIVLVPVLWLLFLWQGFPQGGLMQVVVATSLATIVFTAASATWTHHRRGAVRWSLAGALAPGVLAGSLLGGLLADGLPSEALRRFFGGFELFVAWRLWRRPPPAPARDLPKRPGMLAAGGGIGLLSALMGIGGGTLTVPFLLWRGVEMRPAVATSSACGIPIALAGVLALTAGGWGRADLPPATLGYVHWPAALFIVLGSPVGAYLGARLAYRLSVPLLRRIFALLLIPVGLRMLW
ncbi:MAG: sulfite exporter TauE/SafE family protein [Gammaproteobacteria bacterium]|nr:sulfite exporter TauE/SafE family protein [Gammaproteobacteria bacterium]